MIAQDSQHIIVYDLETKHTFAEVGGYENNHKLGVSYLGLYSYSQEQYFGFEEDGLNRLEAIMAKERPLVIGFNSINFDNVVLQPYFQELNVSELPQLDILAEINDTLGFRMKLESVAQATLGEGKSGTGLDAIKYYREGNMEALAKYCMDDVRITKEIYDFGREHGFILYTSGGQLQRMPTSWKGELTISEKITQAHAEHQQLNITYLEVPESGEPSRYDTTIDIHSIDGNMMEAYCHVQHATREMDVNRVLAAENTQTNYAYQGSLL